MNCQPWITLSQEHIPVNSKLSCTFFEDNEAVIKLVMSGRSPSMGHVSRTHRVASDRVLERVNLDPKLQIKYVDNKKSTR